jgi:hypothetical protein
VPVLSPTARAVRGGWITSDGFVVFDVGNGAHRAFRSASKAAEHLRLGRVAYGQSPMRVAIAFVR